MSYLTLATDLERVGAVRISGTRGDHARLFDKQVGIMSRMLCASVVIDGYLFAGGDRRRPSQIFLRCGSPDLVHFSDFPRCST
jgi:hypothetical protein